MLPRLRQFCFPVNRLTESLTTFVNTINLSGANASLMRIGETEFQSDLELVVQYNGRYSDGS
jgi:hypothetical protein